MADRQKEIDALDRQLKALALRKAGVSYLSIAKSLGYRGTSGAYKAVRSALMKTLREPAAEVRNLELTRLDDMLFAIWPQVRQGSQGAIDRAIKILERRAKLLGLDAPVQQTNRNLNLDLFDLPTDVLERIAAGEDPIVVLATSRPGGTGTKEAAG